MTDPSLWLVVSGLLALVTFLIWVYAAYEERKAYEREIARAVRGLRVHTNVWDRAGVSDNGETDHW